jgi:hypothetical protein
MQKLWRPAMGWMYMLICLLDMAVFPVCWSILQAVMHVPITQWNPLTLQGAGLFHIAMGAVLGISAFGRTQEKLAGTAANPTSTTTSTGGFGNGNTTAPATGFQSGTPAFGSAPTGGFGSAGSFNSPAPSSFGGGGFGSTPPAPATSTSFTPPASWGTTPIATTASGKKLVPDEPQPAI